MNADFLTNKEAPGDIALDDLIDLCDFYQKQLLHACSKNSLDELGQLLSDYRYLLFTIQAIMSHAEKQMGNLGDIIFQLGVLTAQLVFTEKLHASQKSAKALTRPHTIYKDQIIEILYQNGPTMHKTLAEKLNIAPNNLSNIIRRLKSEEVPLIEETLVGKYKYYTLNRTGRIYVKEKLEQELPSIVQLSSYTVSGTTSFQDIFIKMGKDIFRQNLEQDIREYSETGFFQISLPACDSYNNSFKEFTIKYKQLEKEIQKQSTLSSVNKHFIRKKEAPLQAVQ